MKTSPSQRALETLLKETPRSHPIRTALAGICTDSELYKYSTGRTVPSASRAGEIQIATEKAVPADGWISDGEQP